MKTSIEARSTATIGDGGKVSNNRKLKDRVLRDVTNNLGRGFNGKQDNSLNLPSDIPMEAQQNKVHIWLEEHRNAWRDPEMNWNESSTGRPPDCVMKEGQTSSQSYNQWELKEID